MKEHAEPEEQAMTSNKLSIDWTVPVPVLIALALQAGTVVWWGAGIDRRVSALEQASASNSQTPVTIARLDERTSSLAEAMQRVERHLETIESDHDQR